jgi:hypothetical protein
MNILWAIIAALVLINISCANKSGHIKEPNSLNVHPAYSQIAAHSLSNTVPLGGSFEAGVAIFQDKNAAQEAGSVYKNFGITMLATQDTLTPPGIETASLAKTLLDNKEIKFVTIPATSDVVTNKAMPYHFLTRKFAAEFNLKMLELSNLTGEYAIEYIPFDFTYRSGITSGNFSSKAHCKVTKMDKGLAVVFQQKWNKDSQDNPDVRIKITNLTDKRTVFVDKSFALHGADGFSTLDGNDRILIENLQAELDKCARQKWIKMVCLNREKPSKLLKEQCSKLNSGKWPSSMVLE